MRPSPWRGQGRSASEIAGECRAWPRFYAARACPLLARSCQTLSAPGLRRWIEPLRIGPIDAPDLGVRLQLLRARLRRSPLFMQRERKHASTRRCADCRYSSRCSVCPVAIAHGGDDPQLVPEFLCAFNRVSLKYQERFPPQWGVLA